MASAVHEPIKGTQFEPLKFDNASSVAMELRAGGAKTKLGVCAPGPA